MERARGFVRSFSDALANMNDRVFTDIKRGTKRRHKKPLKQPLL